MKRIYILITILVSLMVITNVNASVKTYERNETNNYGVKKEIIFDDNKLEHVKNTRLVDASEKIYDFADLLTNEEESELKKLIDSFIEKTNMDLVILTDVLSYSKDEENDIYATDFYDYNDFGMNTDHYDGILLFRNAYSADPYFDVYLTGEAQIYYTFERCDATLDEVYNYFSSKNHVEGIRVFIEEFDKYYDEGIPTEYKNAYIDENGFVVVKKEYNPPLIISAIIAFFTSLFSTKSKISKNKMVYKAKEADNYLDKQSIKYSRQDTKLVSTHTVQRYNPPSSSSSGGGHSFSGSSGIGHSSGGGRHG